MVLETTEGGQDLQSVLSPGVPLSCSSQNELRPSLTVSAFFSNNFHCCYPAPVLLDTVNRSSQDKSAQETGGVQSQLLVG